MSPGSIILGVSKVHYNLVYWLHSPISSRLTETWTSVQRQQLPKLSTHVLVLGRALPLAPGPLVVEQEVVVLVGESNRREGPRSVVSRAVSVAASKSVSTGKSNNLLVVEAHTVEDVTEVVLALRGVGETAIGGLVDLETVNTSWAPGDDGAASLLDGTDTTKSPQVTVRDPGELLLDTLHVVTGNVQASVGTVVGLVLETHGSIVGTTSLVVLVIGSRCVPGKTENNGGKRAIVIVLLVEASSNSIVDLLVVGLRVLLHCLEVLGGALDVKVPVSTTGSSDESCDTDEDTVTTRLGGRWRGRRCALYRQRQLNI